MRILTLISRQDRNIDALSRHFSMIKGFEVVNWNPSVKSAFDAFDEYNPDMLLFNKSLSGLIGNVKVAFPNTKFVCEDDSSSDTNEFDLTFTTVINKQFQNKKYVNIGYDIASYINRTKKSIYHTHICFNGDMNNPKNMSEFQALVNPTTDVRINGCAKLYGVNHGGEYACGVLSSVDQFAAYEQAKVCIFLKNWITDDVYESPPTLQNAYKVNTNLIHNIPEIMQVGFYADTKKDILDTVQKLLTNTEKLESEPVSNTFIACRDLLGDEYTPEIEALTRDLTERYSL